MRFNDMLNKLFLLLPLLVSLASCGGRGLVTGNGAQVTGTETAATHKVEPPVRYTYKVLNVYPHSTKAYTQGLLWHDGVLYEGTGQRGESCLRITRLDGTQLRSMPLDDSLFGEGIVLLNGEIIQLTWTSGEAFVYDAETFRTKRIFRYEGEGWGLATDGELLYMSNGSDEITVRDPKTFNVKRTFTVATNLGTVNCLNELEWINGDLWANVYTTDNIVIIDPQSGDVKGIVDLSGLQSEEDRTPLTDVLNGIAYDEETGRIFVTGKYWNKLYEIELVEQK